MQETKITPKYAIRSLVVFIAFLFAGSLGEQGHLSAQDITCETISSGEYTDPTIWSCGHVPDSSTRYNYVIFAAGTNVTVPVNTEFIISAGDTFIAGTLINNGMLTFSRTPVMHWGTLINNGTVINGDLLSSEPGSIFENYGTYINNDENDISGSYYNYGTFVFNRSASVRSTMMINYGSIENHATIFVFNNAILTNNGTFINSPNLFGENYGVEIEPGSQLDNLNFFGNYSNVRNNGTFNNQAIVENYCLATIGPNPVVGNPPVNISCNTPPVANAGLNQTVLLNSLTMLDGSASYDVDADPLSYYWLEDSSNAVTSVLSDPASATPFFTPTIDGIYTFHLTVNDGLYDSLPSTVVIHVQTASQAIEDLIALVGSFNVQQGIANSLDAKLNSALKALQDINQNNDVAAVNSLQAFINAVEAQRGDRLTNEQADMLIQTAQLIINSL